MPQELIIHCGFHKTGSTSLQNALKDGQQLMRLGGTLYPEAGMPSIFSGHHNLAWQLSRDRRFNAAAGTFDDLWAEVAAYKGPRVLISSEDFENSVMHPEQWGPLVKGAAAAGMKLTFIIYLRDVSRYMQSAYVENMKTGFGEEYALFVRDALDFGRVRSEEWEFCFDYRRVAASLQKLGDVQLMFRRYEALVGGSTVSDFGAAIKANLDIAPVFASSRRDNNPGELPPLLLQFASNRDPMIRNLSAFVWNFLLRLFEGRPAVQLATPPAMAKVLNARFPAFFPPLAQDPVPRKRDEGRVPVNIVRVFSFETQQMLRQALVAARTDDGSYLETDEIWARRAPIMEHWWRWVLQLG